MQYFQTNPKDDDLLEKFLLDEHLMLSIFQQRSFTSCARSLSATKTASGIATAIISLRPNPTICCEALSLLKRNFDNQLSAHFLKQLHRFHQA